jgi:hypothetical protein
VDRKANDLPLSRYAIRPKGSRPGRVTADILLATAKLDRPSDVSPLGCAADGVSSRCPQTRAPLTSSSPGLFRHCAVHRSSPDVQTTAGRVSSGRGHNTAFARRGRERRRYLNLKFTGSPASAQSFVRTGPAREVHSSLKGDIYDEVGKVALHPGVPTRKTASRRPLQLRNVQRLAGEGDRLARSPIAREAQAHEADQHHGPSRGLGNGRKGRTELSRSKISEIVPARVSPRTGLARR